jgi:hypothetical protein
MRVSQVPAVGLEPTYKIAQNRINTMFAYLFYMLRHKIKVPIHAPFMAVSYLIMK